MVLFVILCILVLIVVLFGSSDKVSGKVVDVSKSRKSEYKIDPFRDELDRIQKERDRCKKDLEEKLEWQRKHDEYAEELKDLETQMKILNRIVETSETSRQENDVLLSKDKAKSIGSDFECYVADLMKDQGFFLKEWNQGCTAPGGAFAQDSLKPDFLVSISENGTDLEFWIECKYRSRLKKDGFTIQDYQLERYRKIQRESKRKILIVLGLAGSPKNPYDLFIIPFEAIVKYKGIKPLYLSCYEIRDRSCFRKHIADWFFNVVFKKPRNFNKFSAN